MSAEIIKMFYIHLEKQLSPQAVKILDLIKQDLRQRVREKVAHIEKVEWQKREMARLVRLGLK